MNKKILVVDDEPRNIQVVGALLRDNNFKVEYAINGQEALDWVKNENFDLILLDIMMPQMDGYEVCKHIRVDLEFTDVPIFFLTGKNEVQDITKGFKAGAVDYITKPFNSDELLSRINTHLQIFEQRKELEELNRIKDKFISLIAHDLRGPIGSIVSCIDIFREGIKKERDFNRILLLDELYKTAENTYKLMDELLAWGRVISKRIEHSPELNNVSLAVKEVKDILEPIAKNKNISIDINLDENLKACFDKNMLRTILRNLITNAIKFSNASGKIIVSAEIKPLDEKLVLKVKDNGIGMNTETARNILKLDRFKSTPGTNGEKGTGLGLHICKEFTEINGGNLWIISKENEGTEVCFTLPIFE